MLMLPSLPRHTGAQTMVDMELEVLEHVSNKCASTEQSSLQTCIWIRRKACCAQEKMSSTSNTMQRCGGQNTMHCEVVSQYYRTHRLLPAPIDDKANCTRGCEVPLEDRPCCLTALFCARIHNDGKQHGATQKMSMLTSRSPFLT